MGVKTLVISNSLNNTCFIHWDVLELIVQLVQIVYVCNFGFVVKHFYTGPMVVQCAALLPQTSKVWRFESAYRTPRGDVVFLWFLPQSKVRLAGHSELIVSVSELVFEYVCPAVDWCPIPPWVRPCLVPVGSRISFMYP